MSINYTRDASDQIPDVGDIRTVMKQIENHLHTLTDDRFADIHSKLDGVFEVVNKLNQLLTVTSTDVKEIKFLLNEVALKQQVSQETQTLPQEQLNQTSNSHGSNNIVSSAVDQPQALDFQKLKPSDASTPLASPFKHEESKQSQLKDSAKIEATLTSPEKNEAKFSQIEASAKNEAKELEAEPTSTKKAVPDRSHIQLDTTDEAFDGKMKELLFKRECKLFTFVRETKETFLRGHGIIYVVYHRNTNIFKVFMKRNNDQKICAVFKIRRNMQLSDKSGSKSTGLFKCMDFSEGEPKATCFFIKFQEQTSYEEFKKLFNDAVENDRLKNENNDAKSESSKESGNVNPMDIGQQISYNSSVADSNVTNVHDGSSTQHASPHLNSALPIPPPRGCNRDLVLQSNDASFIKFAKIPIYDSEA